MVHESRRMLSEFPSADAKLTDMSGLNSPATTAISDELKGAGKVSVIVVNPKNSDERTKPLLEDALVLYNTELPSLSYAANTGKESRFLKNCVTNGKYRTLLLKDHVLDGTNNVIAAITFQIIPADTQYAEIPVAAVRKDYQRKGLGTILYRELHMRLQDVGVLAIFCWGDLESEPFWAKQGFLKIAEIDDRGRPKKLRLKADVRRAMCMPGSATLMICELRGTAIERTLLPAANNAIAGHSASLQAGLPQMPPGSELARASPSLSIKTPTIEDPKPSHLMTLDGECDHEIRINPAGGDDLHNLAPLNIAGAFACVAGRHSGNNDENITPRATPKHSQNASPHNSSVEGPTMRDKVLKDVTNLTPKPTGQLFCALCDVASNFADQTENKAGNKCASSATKQGEQENCQPYAPEQGFIPGQEHIKAGLVQHVGSVPEVTEGKHREAVLRTYRKRRGNPQVLAPQETAILPEKPAGTEWLGVEQLPVAEIAIQETGPEARAKKQRNASENRIGDQVPVDELKDNPVVSSRVLRSSSRNKSGHGVVATSPKVDGRSQTVGVEKLRDDQMSMDGSEGLQVLDVMMPEAFESATGVQIVSRSCELEANHHSRSCNAGTTTCQVCGAGKCHDSEDVHSPAPNPLVSTASTCQHPREGQENCNLIFEIEDARDRLMTELIVSEEGTKAQVGSGVLGVEADADQCAELVHPLTGKPGQLNRVITENAVGESMPLNTDLTVPEQCLETWGSHGHERPEVVVMFMNMANEKRRKQLTQFVEQLGGRVTTQGLECTHVVTGEVRTTLNFCTALCGGAWVVSSDWLRDSVKTKKFAGSPSCSGKKTRDPSLYIFPDKNFQLKYGITVEEVVSRARRTRKSLLKGFQFYLSPNVNLGLDTVVSLIRSAGGIVLSSLQEAVASKDPSHTIMLACEEETLEALEVSRRGMWVFSADWFMSCIIRQQLDFNQPQFAETLS